MLKFSQVTPPSLAIAVICGGDSSEREISLASGQAMLSGLASLGHRCMELDPSAKDFDAVNWLDFDVAAIGLHGKFGEDGQLQQLLQSKGVPFTGSDSTASALAFSKTASKQRFIATDVPTPEFAVVNKNDALSDIQSDSAAKIARLALEIGYPIVVKPDSEGSSFGVTIVESPDQLPEALATCFQFGSTALIERAIAGSEWTVAVIDDQPLDPICIETPRPFYDFQAKYEVDTTCYAFETKVEPSVIQLIQTTGLAACRSLGTSGVARADLRLDEFNRPWVLEVNTIPGMTAHSLVPKAAQRAGLSFAQLCQRMVDSCLKSCSSTVRKSA